ncbi:TPA: glycosyltransferase family 2 protein [Salmonella enterica]|nr:glycosyltransferase family 2 protein [Salmonella enterica]
MKISIIITAFNVEKYIGECILSVLRANYPDMEIIVINDGSTDQTGLIIDSFKTLQCPVTIIHTENRGQSVVRNTGVYCSTDDYIIFLDGDDKLHPDSLCRLSEILKNKLVDIIFFESEVFFDDDSLAA